MNTKYLISIITLFLPFLASAQEMQHYALNVSDFNELKVVDGINVDYKCSADSAGIVTFDTTPDKASILMFSNDKSRLKVQLYSDGATFTDIPTVTVYSNYLQKVENSGDSTVRVLSIASGASFKARLIGNGRIVARNIHSTSVDASIDTGSGNLTIYGKCQSAKYTLTGTGNIQADELNATNVKCVLFGTGTIGCAVSDKFSIYGASSATIYYRGNPTTIKNRSVGVKLSQLESTTTNE
jgi:hypothetical protein